jgi:hypothetical protein
VWGRIRDAAGRATVQGAGTVNATAYLQEGAVAANETASVPLSSSGGGEGDALLAAIGKMLDKMRGVGQSAGIAQLALGRKMHLGYLLA